MSKVTLVLFRLNFAPTDAILKQENFAGNHRHVVNGGE